MHDLQNEEPNREQDKQAQEQQKEHQCQCGKHQHDENEVAKFWDDVPQEPTYDSRAGA